MSGWQGLKNWTKQTKILVGVIVTATVVVCAWMIADFLDHPVGTYETFSAYLMSLPDHSLIQTTIGGREFRLEVVNTQVSIQQGLSDRSEIGSDGMLFVMPTKGHHSFWMPRMNFDLDILWLDENRILQISDHIPAEPASKQQWQLPLYTSEQPANVVLEIPAGRAELTGIQVGDTVELVLE